MRGGEENAMAEKSKWKSQRKKKNDRRRKAEKRKVYSDVKSFGTRSAENSSGNNV